MRGFRCAPSGAMRVTKNSSLPLLLTLSPEDLEAQECVPSRIAKIEQELLGWGATTVKHHQKTSGAKRLLAALVLVAVSPPRNLLCLCRWSG